MQIDLRRADRDVADGERSPVGGNVGREGERARGGVWREAEQTAQDRADDHGRGPDLVRRAGGQRLVVRAGKHFRKVAERAIEREQCVGAQIFVRGQSAVIAIFPDGGPAGEERPHRAVMVAPAAEFRRMVRDDAHAPVGLLIDVGKLRNHDIGFGFVEQTEPHRNG